MKAAERRQKKLESYGTDTVYGPIIGGLAILVEAIDDFRLSYERVNSNVARKSAGHCVDHDILDCTQCEFMENIPDPLPDCPKCGNTGEIRHTTASGAISERKYPCPLNCGHPVKP